MHYLFCETIFMYRIRVVCPSIHCGRLPEVIIYVYLWPSSIRGLLQQVILCEHQPWH